MPTLPLENIPADVYRLSVPTGRSVVVSAVGLTPQDNIVLWRRACDYKTCPNDGTDRWVPFVMCGKQPALNVKNTVLCIEFPGEYYLAFEGIVNPDVEICQDEPREGGCPCGC